MIAASLPHLQPDRFDDEVAERTAIPGVVTGLAWTASGSGGLLFIEATQMPGKGNLQLTGKLGDVIKESAQIGVTWVRTHAADLGITKKATDMLLDKSDIHIHFPAGATPKDGPSAGITIVTALVSLFTGKPVREHTAMVGLRESFPEIVLDLSTDSSLRLQTGEITLRGQVLPVGGIKEKVLAAHRGGIRRIILPFRNKVGRNVDGHAQSVLLTRNRLAFPNQQKDLVDVPNNVKDEIEFVFAKSISDVVRFAFEDGAAMADRIIAPGMEPFVQAKL